MATYRGLQSNNSINPMPRLAPVVTWLSDYRQVLDWWSDLLDSLIQRVTIFYNSLLHTNTSIHGHVFTSRSSVATSNGGRYPSSLLPNYPATSFSQQQLATTEPQKFSDWLPQSLSNCLAYNISARTAQKTPFQYCCEIIACQWHDVFDRCVRNHRHGPRRKHHSSVYVYGQLLSDGWYISAYFRVVA
jgi:hypothetical protein